MADNRSKADKLRAMADPKNNATQGERDNAIALLAKVFGQSMAAAGVIARAGMTFLRVGTREYVLEVREVTRGDHIGELYLYCPCPAWKYAMGRGDVCKHAHDVLRNELAGKTATEGGVLV